MKRVAIAIAMALAVIAVYALRLDQVAGLYKDDAYYIVLAQSLAAGHGYALISSAVSPILPGFPPGFALLLAPVVAVTPSYPGNVLWLKLPSIAAMLGTGWLTFRYLHGYRAVAQGRAATIAVLTTLTPGLVFLATSTVLSECLFTFALMASAVALERAARMPDDKPSPRAIVVAALLTTAAWLIRAAGVSLVAGGALFLFWKRGWRAAAGFLVVCALSYAPWTAYSVMHSPTPAERAVHGGDIVRGYRAPSDAGLGAVRRRIAANVVNVFGRDIGAMILPAAYRGAAESGLEAFTLTGANGLRAGSMGIGGPLVAVSSLMTLLVVLGAIAIARRQVGVAEFFCALMILMVVVATNEAVYRYMLPLTPFVIGYFLAGVKSVAAWLRPGTGAAAFRIAAACSLILLTAEHAQYVWLKTQGPPPSLIRDDLEVRSVTDYINTHLPGDAKVVSTNPGLVYLLTGRKGVVYDSPRTNEPLWRAAGIRYAAALNAAPPPSDSRGYRPLFESARLKLWVKELGPAAASDKN